jgi:hypothetical protein
MQAQASVAMFNLLVSAGEGSWDEAAYTFGLDRFLEHTDDALKARFSSLDDEARAVLKRLPTLFAYESYVNQPARVGWIRSIQKRGRDIRITYEFDLAIPPIDAEKIDDLVRELEINNYEMNRTHWAVKAGELMKILRSAGLLNSKIAMRLPSRTSRLTSLQRRPNPRMKEANLGLSRQCPQRLRILRVCNSVLRRRPGRSFSCMDAIEARCMRWPDTWSALA